MNNQQLIENFFTELGKDDIKSGVVSGMISIKIGQLANSIVNICGKHYSFMNGPEFYACYAFYANCSFAECCNSKMMQVYNSKNKDKITKFNSMQDLTNFLH